MNYTSKGFKLPEGNEFFSKDHANFNAEKSDDLIVALENASVRPARFVIGTSFDNQGWEALDCNYLCDGTDDQVEINAAIAALPSSGGEIVILDGVYNITSAIMVDKNNVTIRGNGATLKRMYEETSILDGVITIKNATNCRVENFSVDGNMSVYDANNNYGILLSSSNNNSIIGNVCSSNYNGIGVYKSNNNTVADNTCNSNDTGITLFTNSAENILTNNTCKNNAYGISLYSANNNTISANSYNNTSYGIFLSSSNNNTITGNTCYDNGIGIYMYMSSKNTIISNTCIRGTGLPEDYEASQHTIQISTSSDYNLVANNNCMGKAVVIGGEGNTVVNNKWDASDDIQEIRQSINSLEAEVDEHLEENIPYHVRTATIIVAASDSKFKEYADYVCSGVNDHSIIVAAINALPLYGGKVVLLEGNYNTGRFIIEKSNVIIEGCGFSTVINSSYEGNSSSITINGENCVLTNIKIDNDGNSNYGVGTDSNAGYGLKLINVWSTNSLGRGFTLRGANISLLNCVATLNNTGIRVTPECLNTIINNCHIFDNETSQIDDSGTNTILGTNYIGEVG